MYKKLVSTIYIKDGKAVDGFRNHVAFGDGDAVKLAELYSNKGADALLIFDLSQGDAEHEVSLGLIKEMSRLVDIPMYGCGNIRRVEDVKKLIYAGCRKAVLNYSKDSNREMLEEVSKRFGKDKIAVCIAADREKVDEEAARALGEFAGELVFLTEKAFDDDFLMLKIIETQEDPGQVFISDGAAPTSLDGEQEIRFSGGSQSPTELPVLAVFTGETQLRGEEITKLLKSGQISGYSEHALRAPDGDIMDRKAWLKEQGVEVNTYESSFSWSDFKVNSDGLVPVIVQDYKTQEVLMMAYMNQEAYEATVRSGRMTYWSRSRRELWIKGLTSGHFQYVKELQIDCDNDTILAKVAQVGAACHTGNRSCFYRTMMKKDYVERNPLKVFEDVYAVIEDRKLHPKEGSYTNYLFDKGIDKILKKVGEEATEIIIAAKNPNPEEIKYEISDFLYHVMVLMAERGVTWEDIAKELADR